MKIIARILFLSFFVLGLEGCFSMPPGRADIPKNTDHGAYPKNYKEIVKLHLDNSLVRPYSTVIYDITEPKKAYDRRSGPIWRSGLGDPTNYGWHSRVCYSSKTVNLKKIYRCYNLLIKNDSVIVNFTLKYYYDEPDNYTRLEPWFGCLTYFEHKYWMIDVRKGNDGSSSNPYDVSIYC